MLVARNKLRVARSLLRATSCAGVNAAYQFQWSTPSVTVTNTKLRVMLPPHFRRPSDLPVMPHCTPCLSGLTARVCVLMKGLANNLYQLSGLLLVHMLWTGKRVYGVLNNLWLLVALDNSSTLIPSSSKLNIALCGWVTNRWFECVDAC